MGIASTLADLAALAVLVELARLSPIVANVPALLLGLAIQFAGNKWFAFRDTSRAYLRQGLAFALVEVGALALNALAFHLAAVHTHVPYALSRLLCSAGVYALYSYPLWGLVFRPGRPASPEVPASDARHSRPATKEGEPCSSQSS